MKSIHLLFILSVSINCQDLTIEEALKFYPMHIGDYWQYQAISFGIIGDSTWITNKEIIGDTIMPNQKKYFILNNGSCTRVDSSNANMYSYWSNWEYRVDSLLAKKGDKITECYELVDDPIKNILGIDVKTRFVDYVCTTTEITRGWEYAENLGEVMSYYNAGNSLEISYRNELIYAKINGVEYGIKSDLNDLPKTPHEFKLYQNYPNPFNTVTTIKYELKEPGAVELSLYDIQGRKIAVLIDEYQQADQYEVRFDGESLSSGIYTYRLISNNFLKVRKMLLIK
ncbi:T9SS type A sorting domain-containing protein [bacterium]|nr:T9SS type A sorting domain-containing protein [bacterium]